MIARHGVKRFKKKTVGAYWLDTFTKVYKAKFVMDQLNSALQKNFNV